MPYTCDLHQNFGRSLTIEKLNPQLIFHNSNTAFLHESRPEALYNFWAVGSWSAWANDVAAHYAAIRCPRERTVGPAVCS